MVNMREMDINFLHVLVLREAESDSVQEIDPNMYRSISDFLGGLKKQEFDGVEDKIRELMISMATELTSLLITYRVEKISKLPRSEIKNILDEEKFILDSHEQWHEKMDIILSAIVHGQSKLLESISQKHKTRPMVVRFLQDVDTMVGTDMEKYGPFKAEDIAAIPYENAQALIAKDAATKIRWQD